MHRRQRLIWGPHGLGAREVSKRFASAISDPTFAREVWLVMGSGLSHAKFIKAVGGMRGYPQFLPVIPTCVTGKKPEKTQFHSV
jgi:hypothetical protein